MLPSGLCGRMQQRAAVCPQHRHLQTCSQPWVHAPAAGTVGKQTGSAQVATPCSSWSGRRSRAVSRASQKDNEALQVVTALGQVVKPGWMDLLTGILSTPPSSTSSKPSTQRPQQPDWQSPVYTLVAAQTLSFLLTNVLALLPTSALALSLKSPQWWQLLTSGFAISSWQHLGETVFLTYILGRLLERSSGVWGLWLCFLTSVVGANALALWLLPAKVAAPVIATSAGVFGLFAAGLLLPRLTAKPLEVACLAPLIVTSALTQYSPLMGLLVVEGLKVGHLVHLAGAFLGASIVWSVLTALNMYKMRIELEKEERERQERLKRQQEQASIMAKALGSAAKAATDVAKKMF